MLFTERSSWLCFNSFLLYSYYFDPDWKHVKKIILPLVSFKSKFLIWWFLGLPNPDHRQGIASQIAFGFFMLLMSRNFALPTSSGFQQRKPFPLLLTQDRYGSGAPLGGSDVQQGMALNQNAFLPLLLGNPDFLKLYMENPLLASQYATLLMRGNVCQIIQKACTCSITCFQLLLLSTKYVYTYIYIVQFTLF